MKRKFQPVFVLVALYVGLFGCVIASNRTGSAPSIEPIPDLPIVYNIATRTNVLGFGNLDDGDTVEMSVYSEGPMVSYVSWSLDGTSLVSRMRISQSPESGYPMLIQGDGSVLTCPIFGTDGLTALDDRTVITVKDETTVVRVDMETCEMGVIYSHDTYIGDLAYSSLGWIALDDNISLHLIIIDDTGNIVSTVPNCTLRSWSVDGEKLAYRCEDGLYVSDKSGNDPRLVLEDVGWVGWIDNDALLIGRELDVWFFDMTTREEYRLFPNASSPSWCPGRER